MVDPETFYRFNMDGAQWTIGLGNYVYKEKGWKLLRQLPKIIHLAIRTSWDLPLSFVAPRTSWNASGFHLEPRIFPLSLLPCQKM